MATHSNILAWKIPWTEELMGYSPWGLKESEATELARRTANSIVAPFLSFFLSSLLYSSFPPSFSLITGSSLYSLVFVVKWFIVGVSESIERLKQHPNNELQGKKENTGKSTSQNIQWLHTLYTIPLFWKDSQVPRAIVWMFLRLQYRHRHLNVHRVSELEGTLMDLLFQIPHFTDRGARGR